MPTSHYSEQVDQLRQALLGGDAERAEAPQAWLMGEIASALQAQDRDKMMELRGHLANLIPLADHHGSGKPGDRWRAVWELLQACSATHRPLEQYRLAEPGRLSGLILAQIKRQPGITPSELAGDLKKQANQISNELRRLRDEGLVHRVPEGAQRQYFLTSAARTLLVGQSPVRLVVQPQREYLHLREERLKQRENPNELPCFAVR